MLFQRNLIKSIILLPLVIVISISYEAVGVKYNFSNPEPGNALGIYTTVMTIIEREAKKTTDIWKLNKNYITDENWDSFRQACDGGLNGMKCKFTDSDLTFRVKEGIPEEKNITIVYLAVEFKMFRKQTPEGEKFCIFDMVPESKIYYVIKTFSELPKNNTKIPKSILESVTNIHHHQLSAFPESSLEYFGDKIDGDGVYMFNKEDYEERDEPYDCFIAIGTSASVEVLEKKCHFQCGRVVLEDDPNFQKFQKVADGRKIIYKNELDHVYDEDNDGDGDDDQDFITDNHVEL